MNDLKSYCNQALLSIEKSKKYLSYGIHLNGNLMINIVKSFILKKIRSNINDLNELIKNINIYIPDKKIKYFSSKSSDVVIYEDAQINSIVYSDLSRLEYYLNSLEKEIKELSLTTNNKD